MLNLKIRSKGQQKVSISIYPATVCEQKTSQFVLINLDCLMLFPCCFSMNTDSLSVAPVRHPVVQISSELHATTLTEGENKGESREDL